MARPFFSPGRVGNVYSGSVCLRCGIADKNIGHGALPFAMPPHRGSVIRRWIPDKPSNHKTSIPTPLEPKVSNPQARGVVAHDALNMLWYGRPNLNFSKCSA